MVFQKKKINNKKEITRENYEDEIRSERKSVEGVV
jgi:hypothetical protein